MWPFRRRAARPSPDALAASAHADRALIDARNLDSKVDRAVEMAAEIKRVNHIALAVARSIRGV